MVKSGQVLFQKMKKTGELPVWKAAIPGSAFPERNDSSDQFIINRKSPENLPVCEDSFSGLVLFFIAQYP